MIEKKDIFSLEILPLGQVQVLKQTQFIEDGVVLSTQNWRTTLETGDFGSAQQILPAYELSIVQAAWTPAKIQEYEIWKVEQQ